MIRYLMRPAAAALVDNARWPISTVALLGFVAWGARATWLEGIQAGASRAFVGDFAVALDVQAKFGGIIYGPIIVFESWLVRATPQLPSAYAFGVANIVLILVAFGACAIASGTTTRTRLLLLLATWLCFNRLYIAISVSAHPEILELTVLSLAWFAASRNRHLSEGGAIAVAAMTKLIPVVFAIQLATRRRVRALVAMASVSLVLILFAAIGEHLSPGEALAQTLIPFGNRYTATELPQALFYRDFTDMRSALGRMILGGELGTVAVSEERVRRLSTEVTVVAVCSIAAFVAATAWLTWRSWNSSGLALAEKLNLVYGAFFLLIPIATLQSHAWTFVLVLPALTAGLGLAARDTEVVQRWSFSVAVALCYVLIGAPLAAAIPDRIFGTSLLPRWAEIEPIWPTCALLTSFIVYGWSRTRLLRMDASTQSMSPPSDG
jgi:hypothetical protein